MLHQHNVQFEKLVKKEDFEAAHEMLDAQYSKLKAMLEENENHRKGLKSRFKQVVGKNMFSPIGSDTPSTPPTFIERPSSSVTALFPPPGVPKRKVGEEEEDRLLKLPPSVGGGGEADSTKANDDVEDETGTPEFGVTFSKLTLEAQKDLEKRVRDQEFLIQMLELDIVQKTRMLDHLRAGMLSYRSMGMRKPSHSDRELRMRINDGEDIKVKPCEVVRALVFDCGTSETKALLYTYERSKACQVTIEQIVLKGDGGSTKRSGVIEHILNRTWRKNVVKDFSDLYLEATSRNKSNTHGESGTGLDFCIVGASAWARKKYDDVATNNEKNRLMYELRESGLFPKIFAQEDESSFELLATIYAFYMARETGMIGHREEFKGVLGSGGGSGATRGRPGVVGPRGVRDGRARRHRRRVRRR